MSPFPVWVILDVSISAGGQVLMLMDESILVHVRACACVWWGWVTLVKPDTIFNCYLLWFHDKTDTSSYDSTDVC